MLQLARTMRRGYSSTPAKTRMNLCAAINDALGLSLAKHDDAILFGEDVAFGGVFRCSAGLADRFGTHRVFDTPLCEQGVAGFAIGYASTGCIAIAEMQFADYIYPSIDQLINEAAKIRFRSGNNENVGGLTVRAPYGAVGHGGLYHSQSVEGFFTHAPGLVVVVPRSPSQAKGLLRACVESKDPALFLEPKALYRSLVEEVETQDYTIPLGVAEVVESGTDITLVGWGAQMRVLSTVRETLRASNISAEVIDVRTLQPWDVQTISCSVSKTGRCLISHEAPKTSGFGAEIAATISERCLLDLQAPVRRTCGLDTPFPLAYEARYLPTAERVLADALRIMEF